MSDRIDDESKTNRSSNLKRLSAALIPGLHVARNYRRSLLRGDLSAGLVLVALLVPQGIAYAQLAGLPPVHGLYATMVPLIAYAIFGPSRILILGPDSAVAPLVAAAIVPLAGSNTEERVALAGMLAVLVGIICLIGGLAGFGFVTDLFSWPVRIGYLAGISVTVIVGQISVLLGVSVSGDGLIDEVRGLADAVDQTNRTSLVLGGLSLLLILVMKRLDRRLPGSLIVVVLGTLAVSVFDLGVATVGSIPAGLPDFVFPDPDSGELGQLTVTALAIALIAFADTSVLSRSYATKLGQVVDQDQELRALGTANLATGLFQGFPLSSSSSRTPVAEAAGARTQLTGLVSAFGLGAVLILGVGLFENLPSAVLAAIVIAAVLGLIDLFAFRKLWRVHRTDFLVACACFLSVAAFGVLEGIGVAVGLSILMFLWRAWHPYHAVLGRANGVKGYHDLTRYPQAKEIPGLMLYRFDAPLFFANAGIFQQQLLSAVQRHEPPPQRVVVAAEPITDLDSTASEMLFELASELQSRGIELGFAEMKDPVKDRLRDFGLFDSIGSDRFYPTLGVAVRQTVEDFDIDWIDWEDSSSQLIETPLANGRSESGNAGP